MAHLTCKRHGRRSHTMKLPDGSIVVRHRDGDVCKTVFLCHPKVGVDFLPVELDRSGSTALLLSQITVDDYPPL